MEIYLLRHAIAVDHGSPGYPNDDRPLTPDGIEKMTKAAEGIAELVEEFDIILTSPMSRAKETAEIAARAVDCEDRVHVSKELAPSATVHDSYTLALGHSDKQRVLLVGHEPNLSRLATYFLGGNSSVIEFKKGAFCRIDITPTAPREPGTLIYLLPPKILRAVGAKSHRRKTA